jgi:phage/plasmid-associated DNA primase
VSDVLTFLILLCLFPGKYIWYCLEVKKDFNIPQAEFQSMLSGEEIALIQKYKDQRSVTWDVPCVLAGNELPAWSDNSGSISRRIILFSFKTALADGKLDTQMSAHLDLEMDCHIRKAGLAYLYQVQVVGGQRLDDYLPYYFKETSEIVKQNTNPLEKFLASKIVGFQKDQETYMPMADFNKLYYEFLGVPQGTLDFPTYRNPFAARGITVVQITKKMMYDGKKVKKGATMLMGVDLIYRLGNSATERTTRDEDDDNADG